MATKWKWLLFVGVGSLIVGAAFLSFGLITGGIDKVKAIATPQKVVKTFDNITGITLDSATTVIIKSGAVDKVTVKYYSDSKFINDTNITTEGNTLAVKNLSKDYIISGAMESIGFDLGTNRLDVHTITITVPKGLTLEKVSGNVRNIYGFDAVNLYDLTINKIDLSTVGITNFYNTKIEGGKLDNTATFYANNSQLKHLSIYAQGGGGIRASTLEDSTLSFHYGNLNLMDTIVRNSQLEDVTEFDDNEVRNFEGGYYENGDSLDLRKVSFENVTYKGAGSVQGEEISFLGSINITATYLDLNLGLTTDSKSNSSWKINSKLANLELADLIENAGTLQVDENGSSSFSKELTDSKANVTIAIDHGNIHLK